MNDNQTEINIRIEAADKGTISPFLRIYEEEGPFLKSFKISTKTVVVGRDKSANLRVQDKYISRKHFQIEFLGHDKLYLQDLGSANGTFLNGKRIDRIKLSDGDEIVVGEKRIVISYKIPKPKIAPPKLSAMPDAETMPEIREGEFKHEKTEIALESDMVTKEVLKTVEEASKESSVSKSRKKLKVVTEVSTVAPEALETTREETSSELGRVLDLPSGKDRRSSVREEFEEEDEQKIRLSRVIMFFVACLAITFLFILIVKYAGNYFKKPKKDGDLAKVEEKVTPKTYKKEKVVIPRPDIKNYKNKPKQTQTETVSEADLRPDLSKTVSEKTNSRRKVKQVAIPTSKPTLSVKRTSKNERRVVTLGNKRIKFRRKREPLRTPRPRPTRREKPTAVAEAVRNLQKKEVLNVDLNSASNTLVASREIQGGKETRKSRKIDIKEVQKLIDVDVNLSIMSEEVMLSEKRDVKQFRQKLKEKISAVSYCYQDALKNNPSVSGRTKVSFTVGKGGRVSRASVSSSTVRDRSLNSCIIRTVKNTRFDEPPHDNFNISYTFKFKKATMDFTR